MPEIPPSPGPSAARISGNWGNDMSERTNRKHASKRLLVAAIGVATVSYMSTQSGCAAGADTPDEESASAAPYDDEPEVAGSEQALAISAAAASAAALPVAIRPKFPPVGNLVPPPVLGRPIVIKPPITIPVPIPVGNLMAPPPVVVIKDLPVAVQGN